MIVFIAKPPFCQPAGTKRPSSTMIWKYLQTIMLLLRLNSSVPGGAPDRKGSPMRKTTPPPFLATVERASKPVVLLVGPYGEAGGGMGRIMDYVIEAGAQRDLPVRFEALDTRGGSGAGAALALVRAVWRILSGGFKRDVHAVHLNMADRGSTLRKGLLLHTARIAGIPTILHLHAAQIIAFHAGLPSPLRAVMKGVFRSATICVVLGEIWRRWVVENMEVAPDRVVVVRNGVPRPIERRPARAGAAFQILFLGNLHER